MKFPFEFSTKLVFRLLLPGLVLAAAFAPLLHYLMRRWGLAIAISYTFPFEVVFWGWFVVLSDMRIYMLFEGRRYWPGWLRRFFMKREQQRLDDLRRIVEIDPPAGHKATQAEREAQVEYLQFPMDDGGDPYVAYPTRLGNLIESFEIYPRRKYGLSSVFYWYRIWLVLDKDTREEIDNSQAVADSAVYLVFVLYVSGLLLWAYAAFAVVAAYGGCWVPVGKLPYVPGPGALFLMGAACIAAGFVFYRLTLPIHERFGEVFKSVFDQFRTKLAFDDIVKEIERVRGSPFGRLSDYKKNRVVWRYLRWHMVRNDQTGKNLKVKDWPHPK